MHGLWNVSDSVRISYSFATADKIIRHPFNLTPPTISWLHLSLDIRFLVYYFFYHI